MANPAVEKLKTFGLRFGDKIAVGVASLLFLVFVVLALSKETIDTTPEDLKSIASAAQTNLNREQPAASIVEKLKADGLVPQGFDKQAREQGTRVVDAAKLALVQPFVRTEPGAGLIREEVKSFVPVPFNLYATAGRGGISLFERDASGNPIPEDPDKVADTKKSSAGGGRGGSSGMLGGTTKKNEAAEQLAREEAALKKQQSQNTIKGQVARQEEEEAAEPQIVDAAAWQTITKGHRWVSVIGLIRHKTFRDQLAKALKLEETQAHPDYVRLELERQSYVPVSSSWSEWVLVDRSANNEVLEWASAAEDEAEELTKKTARLEPLSGFLPYLASGFWTGVHHGQVIDQAKLDQIEQKNEVGVAGAGMGAGEESGRGGMAGMMMGGGGMMMGGGGMQGSGSGGGMIGADMDGGGGRGGMGMGMMGGGGPAALPEHVSDEDTLMVRALDMTVQPDAVYRYRVRVVISNPNLNRDDVAPGVDTSTAEFAGEWSEATEPVNVPPDVAPYALAAGRGGDTAGELVSFDVIAFNPETGATAVKSYSAAPGDIVGRLDNASIVVEGKDKPENASINFNSRQLLIDAMGGLFPVQTVGLVGQPFEVPAVALLLRPDGSVSIRSQPTDSTDEFLDFTKRSYQLSISDEKNKKSKAGAGGIMGGMGGYGGMMGGMMGMGSGGSGPQ